RGCQFPAGARRRRADRLAFSAHGCTTPGAIRRLWRRCSPERNLVADGQRRSSARDLTWIAADSQLSDFDRSTAHALREAISRHPCSGAGDRVPTPTSASLVQAPNFLKSVSANCGCSAGKWITASFDNRTTPYARLRARPFAVSLIIAR